MPSADLAASGSGINGSGTVTVPADPRTVWAALLDETKLRRAIPGCETLLSTGDNRYTAAVVLGVGPVKGQFEAKVTLSDLDEPRAAKIGGTLSGPLGAASGEGRLTLIAVGDGCRIDYRYNVHLSGRVAMIGGRMLHSAARQLIGEFFRRFSRSLGGGDGASRSWKYRLTAMFGARP
jgi:2-furoyl-CoA dehydrogenase large subunit